MRTATQATSPQELERGGGLFPKGEITVKRDDRIISCNYLKVTKSVKLMGVFAKKQAIEFIYYYNPTPNDRNLEFDPKRNLSDDLRIKEP